jgi:acetyl-CoA carboxylase carboxyl transferase subunit beta
MSWFKRTADNISTPNTSKKEIPEGLWIKCSECSKVIPRQDLDDNLWVCPCDKAYHFRLGSQAYFSILFDNNSYEELFADLKAGDPLNFVDKKPYKNRLKEAQDSTGLNDALRVAVGETNGLKIVVACMDFNFIGGSMGSVVGEKIAKAIEHGRINKIPVLVISKSGGARMMEAAFSLMQMAKTSAQLALLEQEKIPYISLLTDPTTGGVTASFAMLGDVNIAEPGALIGFAGPRVIKETIRKELPEGFQTAEYLLEHGFVDRIIDRRNLKEELSTLLKLLYYNY